MSMERYPLKGYPKANYWIKGDKEAGIILGLTPGKVARLRRAERLPYYLFRARYLYHKDELKAWKQLRPAAKANTFYKYKIYCL